MTIDLGENMDRLFPNYSSTKYPYTLPKPYTDVQGKNRALAVLIPYARVATTGHCARYAAKGTINCYKHVNRAQPRDGCSYSCLS